MNELDRELQQLKKDKKSIKKAGYSEIHKQTKKAVKKYNGNTTLLPIRYMKKYPALRVHFNKPQGYSRAKIERIAQKLTDRLQEKGINGVMQVSLEYGLSIRSGKLTPISEGPKLFDPEEYYGLEKTFTTFTQTKFHRFAFTLIQTPSGAPQQHGGNDKYNDCFYNCLLIALSGDIPWKRPDIFKRFLGLERNDKVPLSAMKQIEDKLKIGISVSGDFNYYPTIKGHQCIYIKLINEHYTLDNAITNKVKNISYEERKPIFYDIMTQEAFDGSKRWTITKQEQDDIRSYKTNYFLVSTVEKANKRIDGKLEEIITPLEDQYKQFIEETDILKKETKGTINYYKTFSDINTALYLFDKFSKTFSNPEDIKLDEAEWLGDAGIGSIISHTEYDGPAHEYDVKSMYPSIMNSIQLIPLKRGEFMKFTNEEFKAQKFHPNGIYRCIIKPSEDEQINRLFRFNKNNKYTTITLTHARTLGLEVELIEDNEPNFLYYSRDKCITCKELFGGFVDFMMPLKDKGLPKAKAIINILWGALCEKNTNRKTVKATDEMVEIESLKYLINIEPKSSKDFTITNLETSYTDKFYKTNFARIAPFILSKGRLMISSIMKPHKENIKRVHTDGFMSDIKLNIATGDKLGDLVYKGYCEHITITSNARPEGEFKL